MSFTKKFSICLGIILSLAFSSIALAAQNNMQHQGAQDKAQGGMHNDKMNMPMMQDDKMNMPMMGDAKDGKMMNGMMKGCMMQSMMNDSMRQNKTFSDKAFLSAMIPHHETAVEMANTVLKSSTDAQVKKWAEAVITAQQSEIKQMREWLTTMGGEDTQAATMMKDSMHTMMALPVSKDADINFVSMMIGHHASAVEMAGSAVIASKDEKIINFANNIIRAQLDEIIAYKAWLAAKGY